MALNSITVRVPAKVNLQLSVGPRKADGYHDLVSVFQSVSLYDDVTVTKSLEGSGVTISVTGEHSYGVPEDGSNLAVKAVHLLAEKFDQSFDVHIEVKKSIPVAGGMAGGSADAAATLIAVDALYRLELSREDLHQLGASLGSDVPFMISGGTAVGTGRGDQLTPALSRGTYHWVFALSSVGLSTPAVYGECDRLRGELEIADPKTNDALMQALLSGNPELVGQALNNDLQAAACSLRPALNLILDVGRDYGALGALVSGSGPTVAFLVADEEAGLELAVALTASGVVGSVARASGPVPGARIIN